MLNNFISYFVPPPFLDSQERYREARLLIHTFFITALFSLSYISISLFINFNQGIYAMLMNAFVFSALPFLFRKGAPLLICANIFAAIGALSIYVVIYYSGGFHSPILPWLASTPIVTLLIAGKKSGWAWTIISIAAVVVFAMLELGGHQTPIAYNREYEQAFAISTHTGLVLIVFLISLTFEIGKTNALHKLGLRTQEVTQQKEELEVINKIVSEKNKDITDSINYARRIQDAIMPPPEKMKRLFPESFVLYQPKDIVSGDFYWCEQSLGHSFIAAADCTGHGVPGAFLSIVGNNLLHQSVHEYGITKPAAILNNINTGFSSLIHQLDNNVSLNDGMDISLCSINHKTNKLEHAAAYNPLWFIRNGVLKEYKGDKRPIGASSEQHLFSSNEIDLLPGDTFYIFSDGYADQFGGHSGKKFKYKPLKELVLSIQNKSMEAQKEILKSTFDAWRGDIEQIDDILIIGVRIS